MKKTTRPALVTLLAAVLLLPSCLATGDYGNMIRSTEVDDLFESAAVLPGHTYYWAGPEAAPDAIIAIRDDIVFKSRFWHRSSAPARHLAAWRRMLGTRNAPGTENYYYGSYILAPDGRRIGVWYGYVDYSPVKKIDEHTYTIYAPTPSNMAQARKKRFTGGLDF